MRDCKKGNDSTNYNFEIVERFDVDLQVRHRQISHIQSLCSKSGCWNLEIHSVKNWEHLDGREYSADICTRGNIDPILDWDKYGKSWLLCPEFLAKENVRTDEVSQGGIS